MNGVLGYDPALNIVLAQGQNGRKQWIFFTETRVRCWIDVFPDLQPRKLLLCCDCPKQGVTFSLPIKLSVYKTRMYRSQTDTCEHH